MVCPACQEWIGPRVDRGAGALECPVCGHRHPHRFLPAFIVTGPSGAGKTAVVATLKRLLPEWDVFETDILWDSGGNWTSVKCNWLRIAESLLQGGRPSLLCGTMQPKELARCDTYPFFSRIHWLALLCDEETLVERLRARPAWRHSTEEFIAQNVSYARWFREHAETEFDPPLMILDTTHVTPEETARQIARWAMERWIDER